MKLSLLVLLSVALCLGEKKDVKFFNLYEESCINSLSLNRNHLKLVISNSTIGKLPETDEEFLKFAQCRAQQQGTQDKNGNVNFEILAMFIKYFDRRVYGKETGMVGEELANKAIDSCKNLTGESDTQYLVRIQNCVDVYLRSHFHTNTLKE